MIRLVTRDDSAAVIALALAAGLFPPEEIEVLDKMLAGYFGGNFDDGHRCVLDVETEPLGVAYYAPKTATDRTWELIMIGIRRDTHGQGRGTALLHYVENALRADGQRLLLVETSGTPDFAGARVLHEMWL